MRRGPKTLAAALVALLLAVGMTACGGGDDPDSTATEAAGQQQSRPDNASQGADQNNEDGSGSDSSASDSDGGESQSGASDASDFVPKKHNDSGGGAEEFRVKGGDNSIQEFGEEAGSGEFDEAAVALHNFLDARAEGNWAAACEYMSNSVIESFKKLASQAKQLDETSCAEILEILINPAAAQLMKEEAAKANVRSLRLEDEQGFVIYTGTDGTALAMPMANEDGDWKVASLAGTPLS